MKLLILVTLFLYNFHLSANTQLQNTTCKRCHPKIFNEYQNSMHKKASIFNDPVHKAVWDKHPNKKKGNYTCAKCHTPEDTALLNKQTKLSPNSIQLNKPIACQTCHQIKDIEKHQKSNQNIYTKKPKTFYSADHKRKGTKLTFHDKTSFFGLFHTTEGSPYHNIDYSNENFYNGNVCMGCHSHKENEKGFVVCDMEVKQNDTKQNCISCHMPQIKGSFVNQHNTKTHAYHGSNIVTASPAMLEKYVTFSLKKQANGFTITLENKANHTLFPHPLRLAVLKLYIKREGKIIKLKEEKFSRIIGANGKPTPPWLATTILKDSAIKAYEKRKIEYTTPLQKGDQVIVKFGYHIVNPKMAKKLGIKEEHYIRFILFKRQMFNI